MMSNNPIKSDDPNAIEKLIKKLEKYQEKQNIMKRKNAYFRKHGTMVDYPNMNDETAKKFDSAIANGNSWERQLHPQWKLQNNNQEIF